MVHMIFRTRTLLHAWPLLFSVEKQIKKSKHLVSLHFSPKKSCFLCLPISSLLEERAGIFSAQRETHCRPLFEPGGRPIPKRNIAFSCVQRTIFFSTLREDAIFSSKKGSRFSLSSLRERMENLWALRSKRGSLCPAGQSPKGARFALAEKATRREASFCSFPQATQGSLREKTSFERPTKRTFAFAYLEGPGVGKANLLQKACFNRPKAKSMVAIQKDSTKENKAQSLYAPKVRITGRGCIAVTSSINAAQFTKRPNVRSLDVWAFGKKPYLALSSSSLLFESEASPLWALPGRAKAASLRAQSPKGEGYSISALSSSREERNYPSICPRFALEEKVTVGHTSRESSKKENFVYQYLLSVLLRTAATGSSVKEATEIGSIVSYPNLEAATGLPPLAASSGKRRFPKVAPFCVNSLASQRLAFLSDVPLCSKREQQTTVESINSAVLYWQSRIYSNSSSWASFLVGSFGVARTISKNVKNMLKTDLSSRFAPAQQRSPGFSAQKESSSPFGAREGLFSQNQSFLCFWLFPFVGFMFTLGKNDVPTSFKQLSPLLINSHSEFILREGSDPLLEERAAAVVSHPPLLFPSLSKQGLLASAKQLTKGDYSKRESPCSQTTLAFCAEDQAGYLANATENLTGAAVRSKLTSQRERGFLQNALFDRRLPQANSGLPSNLFKEEKGRSFFGDSGKIKYLGAASLAKEGVQKENDQANSRNPLNNFCLKLLVASSPAACSLFEQSGKPLLLRNQVRSKLRKSEQGVYSKRSSLSFSTSGFSKRGLPVSLWQEGEKQPVPTFPFLTKQPLASSLRSKRALSLNRATSPGTATRDALTQRGTAFSIDSFIKAARLLDNYYKQNDTKVSSSLRSANTFKSDQHFAKRNLVILLPFANQKSVEKENDGFFPALPSSSLPALSKRREGAASLTKDLLARSESSFLWDLTTKSPSCLVELSSTKKKVASLAARRESRVDSLQLAEKVVQFLKRKVLLNFVSVTSAPSSLRKSCFADQGSLSSSSLPALTKRREGAASLGRSEQAPPSSSRVQEAKQSNFFFAMPEEKGRLDASSLEVPVGLRPALLAKRDPEKGREHIIYTKLSKESLYKLLFSSLNSVNDTLPCQRSINFNKVERQAISNSNYGRLKLRHPILMSVCLPGNSLAFGKKSSSFAPLPSSEVLEAEGLHQRSSSLSSLRESRETARRESSTDSVFSTPGEQETFSDPLLPEDLLVAKQKQRWRFILRKKVYNMHLKNKFNSQLAFPPGPLYSKREQEPTGPRFAQEPAGSYSKRGSAGFEKTVEPINDPSGLVPQKGAASLKRQGLTQDYFSLIPQVVGAKNQSEESVAATLLTDSFSKREPIGLWFSLWKTKGKTQNQSFWSYTSFLKQITFKIKKNFLLSRIGPYVCCSLFEQRGTLLKSKDQSKESDQVLSLPSRGGVSEAAFSTSRERHLLSLRAERNEQRGLEQGFSKRELRMFVPVATPEKLVRAYFSVKKASSHLSKLKGRSLFEQSPFGRSAGFPASLRAGNKREGSSSLEHPLASLGAERFFGRDWKQRLLLRKQFSYGPHKNIHSRNSITASLWETNNTVFSNKIRASALSGREVGHLVDLANFRSLAPSLLCSKRGSEATLIGKRGALQSYGLRTLALQNARLFLSNRQSFSSLQVGDARRFTVSSLGTETRSQNLGAYKKYVPHFMFPEGTNVYSPRLLIKNRFVFLSARRESEKRIRSKENLQKIRLFSSIGGQSRQKLAADLEGIPSPFPVSLWQEGAAGSARLAPSCTPSIVTSRFDSLPGELALSFGKKRPRVSESLAALSRRDRDEEREAGTTTVSLSTGRRLTEGQEQEGLVSLKQQFLLTFGQEPSLPSDSKEQEQRKNNQKKRRRKKLKKETRRRKKRKIFYPKPLWMRYRLYSSLLNKRYKSNFNFTNSAGPLCSKREQEPSLRPRSLFEQPARLSPFLHILSGTRVSSLARVKKIDISVGSLSSSLSLRESAARDSLTRGRFALEERAAARPFFGLKKLPSANQILSGLFQTAIEKRSSRFAPAKQLARREEGADVDLLIKKEGIASKNYFTISRSVLEEFKRVLWKSNWLRTNLTPYLKSVTHILNEIKESTKRMELFKNVTSFLNLLGRQSFNINQVGLHTLVDKNKNYGTGGESLVDSLLSALSSSREPRSLLEERAETPVRQEGRRLSSLLSLRARESARRETAKTHRFLTKSCWENSLYLEEYNRITYERLQQFISQIRENSLFLKPFLEQATSLSLLPVAKRGVASPSLLEERDSLSTMPPKMRATHFSHSQKQSKKKQDFLLSIQSKSIWVNLGKTIMSVATSLPTLTNILGEKTRMTSRAGHSTVFSNHQSFHSPSGLALLQRGLTFDFLSFYKKNVWKEELCLPQLRMYWALSKTSYNFAPFVSQNLTGSKDSNNGAKCKAYMKKLWSSPKNKAREQSKYNKTKKMDRDISIKFQLFLNEQYELTQNYENYEIDRISGKSPVSYSLQKREEGVSDSLSCSFLSVPKEVLALLGDREEASPETVTLQVNVTDTPATRSPSSLPLGAARDPLGRSEQPPDKSNQKNRNLVSILFEKYFYKIAQKEAKIAQFQAVRKNESPVLLASPQGSSSQRETARSATRNLQRGTNSSYFLQDESFQRLRASLTQRAAARRGAAPFINLTNKSSYWWLDAISSFAPFEFSHMQFLARNKNSQFILQNESKQELARTDNSSLAYVGNQISPFPYSKGEAQNVNPSLLKERAGKHFLLSGDSTLRETKQISSLLFHFCCILSLISISQIRGLFKFYLLIFSKISKATVGILTTLTVFSSASFHFIKDNESSTLRSGGAVSSSAKQPSLPLSLLPVAKRGEKQTRQEGGLLASPQRISGSSQRETARKESREKQPFPPFPKGVRDEELLLRVSGIRKQPFLKLLHELSGFNKYDQTSKMSSSIIKPLFLWNRALFELPALSSSKEGGKFAQASLSLPARREGEATPLLGEKGALFEQRETAFLLSSLLEERAGLLRPEAGREPQRSPGILATRSAFTKIYTQVYILRFANFMFKNSYVLYLKTNVILKQTFDLLAIVAPRSLFSFFEKPGELIMDWIAFLFLVEWASDMTNNIPENVDYFLGNSLFKTTRHMYGMLLQNASYFFPIGTHQYIGLPSEKYSWFYYSAGSSSLKGQLTPSSFAFGTKDKEANLFPYPKGVLLKESRDGEESLVVNVFTDNSQSSTLQASNKWGGLSSSSSLSSRENALFSSSLNIMEGFLRNITLLNYGSLFIKRLFFSLYELLLFELYQPDTDLMVRNKKGVIFWDIWGDFLMQVAEDSNINVSELASLKEEQIKLLELLSLQNIPFSVRDSKQLFSVVLKKGRYSTKHQCEFAFFDFSKGRNKDRFRIGRNLTKATGDPVLSSGRLHKNLDFAARSEPESAGKAGTVTGSEEAGFFTADSPLPNTLSVVPRRVRKGPETAKLILVQETRPEGHSSQPFFQRKQSFPQQYLSYQGKDTELFIDLHPPKSFSMVSFLKNQESVQYPLGSLVCQIYAGIMSKQIAKNILVVGSSGIEKTLLIQAIAGETEIKIITDNAYRYAMVYRGVAVGIKLLRDVFDSLALHTPCLFLIEDIHAIGERRPLLISDDENTKGAEVTGFASHQREEILPPGEKNLIFYELSKHMVTHYRKPYKGDFSMLIPTNLFCFDLWKNNRLVEGLVPSFERSNALSFVFGKKGASSAAEGVLLPSGEASQGTGEKISNGSSGTKSSGSGYYPLKNEKLPPNPLSTAGHTKPVNNSQNTLFSSVLPTSSALFSSKSSFKNSVSSSYKSHPSLAKQLPARREGSLLASHEQARGKEGSASRVNSLSCGGQYMSPRKIVVEKPWGCETVSMGNLASDGSTGASMTSVVAGDTSTITEGVSNGLLSKPFNSIRVKVAILADTAISTLSVKLDMITDLLVIIDSVKANRGFVVFATTHVPFILDPALRRPGRLDETITLGLFPNLLSRWEILKSSFALFYAGKEQSGFSKGFSLDFLTPGFSSSNFRKLSVRMSDLRTIKGAKTTEIDFQRLATKGCSTREAALNSSLFRTARMKLLLPLRGQESRLAKQPTFLFGRNLDFSLFEQSRSAAPLYSKREQDSAAQATTVNGSDAASCFATGSAPFRKKPSLLQLGQKSTENKWCMLSKTKLCSLQKAYFYASVMLNEANLRAESHKVSHATRSINEQFFNITTSVSLLPRQRQELTETPLPAHASSSLPLGAARDPLGRSEQGGSLLSPSAAGCFVPLYEQGCQQFADSANPLDNSIFNELSPLYMSLYASPELFKRHIITYMSGKLGEMLFFSSSFMYTSKTFTQASYLSKKQPSFSYGLSNTWHAISSLVLSFIHKRFLYHSHLMLPKFLNFNNAMPLLEAPSPPSSNILLPARRYENYKRSFSYFNQTVSSQRLAAEEKIQIHRQQRLVKKLYSLAPSSSKKGNNISLASPQRSSAPLDEQNKGGDSFHPSLLEKRAPNSPSGKRSIASTKQEVGEAYTSLMVGSLASALQKVSNTNFFIQNKIFIRHKNYLTNQWSTGQFPEHNAESTYLSDIDWRYTFVESIGDLLLDFPDADQHYNPRNRRWLLTKGAKAYHNWFDFEKTLYSEIYSHFIFDSFIKAYSSYEQNREILDFYAFYILKNASISDFSCVSGTNKNSVPKINEFETLKLYKRFFCS